MANGIDKLKGEANHHLERVHRRLGGIEREVRAINTRDDAVDVLRRRSLAARATVAAGQTDASVELGPVPPGSYWLVKLISTTAGSGGPCAVYLDVVSDTTLVYFIANAGIFATPGAIEIYARERRSLIFHFYNQLAGQVCTAFAQVEQYSSPPLEDAIEGGD